MTPHGHPLNANGGARGPPSPRAPIQSSAPMAQQQQQRASPAQFASPRTMAQHPQYPHRPQQQYQRPPAPLPLPALREAEVSDLSHLYHDEPLAHAGRPLSQPRRDHIPRPPLQDYNRQPSSGEQYRHAPPPREHFHPQSPPYPPQGQYPHPQLSASTYSPRANHVVSPGDQYRPSLSARPARTTSLNQSVQHLYHRYQDPPPYEHANQEALYSATPQYMDEYDEKYGPRFSPEFQDRPMPPDPRYNVSSSGPHGRESHAYAFPRNRPGGPAVPLIHHIKNDWQKSARPAHKVHHRRASSSSYGSESEFGLGAEWGEFIRSRACRRYLCLYLVTVILFVLVWINWLGPAWGDKSMLTDSLNARTRARNGFFGQNRVVPLKGLIQVQELDPLKVPGSPEASADQSAWSERRLIIVGDIRGCLHELRELLLKANFNPDTDHIITTGDMISRGPSSPEVLSLLMSHNASCVRGNHEDRVVLAHRDLIAPSHHKTIVKQSPNGNSASVVKTETVKNGALSDLELAGVLSEEHMAYISACPLILDLGEIPGMGRTAVVHAGLVPMVNYTEQDPASVMSMRSIDLRSHVPSRDPPPDPSIPASAVDKSNKDRYDRYGRSTVVRWPLLWNAWQGMRKSRDRQTVVYGHDSRAADNSGKSDPGVKHEEWTWGLDGGCVDGGQLNALVITQQGRSGDVRSRTVSVQCRDYSPKKFELGDLGSS